MSTMRTHTRVPLLAVALGSLLALASVAAAQDDQEGPEPLRPPVPRRADNVPYLSYAAVVVVIVAPLAVNFISSKRSHQD